MKLRHISLRTALAAALLLFSTTLQAFTFLHGKQFEVKKATHSDGTVEEFGSIFNIRVYNFEPRYKAVHHYIGPVEKQDVWRYVASANAMTLKDMSGQFADKWTLVSRNAQTGALKVRTKDGTVLEGKINPFPKWSMLAKGNIPTYLFAWVYKGYYKGQDPTLINQESREYILIAGYKDTANYGFSIREMFYCNQSREKYWKKTFPIKVTSDSFSNYLYGKFEAKDGSTQDWFATLVFYLPTSKFCMIDYGTWVGWYADISK